MSFMQNSQPEHYDLSRGLILMLAITCGLCAGSNYFNQPLIYSISESLSVSAEQAAFTIVISQLSYAAGLFVLVPLGDLFEKRGFICLLMCLTGIAQIGLSMSHSVSVLYGFTFLATFFSIAAQVLIPFISNLVCPRKSAELVGILMSGLLMGILSARTIAGLVSTMWSWHYIYLGSGITILLFALVMWKRLPQSNKVSGLTIWKIYQSLFSFAVHEPHLIRRGIVGGLGFGMLTLIFTTMTFLLANAPYHFNDFQIGLFGIVGLAGVFATPWAGKLISRGQDDHVARICICLLIISWLPLYFAQQSLWMYGVGVILAYFGLSALHVLNQNLVYRISATARSRINSIYMTMYFGGAAIGSFLAVFFWKHGGWPVCVILGVCIALLIFLFDRYDYRAMKQSTIP